MMMYIGMYCFIFTGVICLLVVVVLWLKTRRRKHEETMEKTQMLIK